MCTSGLSSGLNQPVVFYPSVGGLDVIRKYGKNTLGFRSARLELRISLVERPVIELAARRLTVLVHSLGETLAQLETLSVRY